MVTNEQVGYVMTDVHPADDRMAPAELCAVSATIRCRILH